MRFAGAISLLVALTLVAWTGAYAQDDDGVDEGAGGDSIDINVDNSVNDSGNSVIDAQYQSQNCTVIINQYNNAIAGDAVAAGNAVAATAAEVNAPVNVVQNCIQAGGDINIDDNNNDDNNDDDTTTDEKSTRKDEVLADTIPNKVLANTGGVSPLLPVSFALVGAGLLGFGILRRR